MLAYVGKVNKLNQNHPPPSFLFLSFSSRTNLGTNTQGPISTVKVSKVPPSASAKRISCNSSSSSFNLKGWANSMLALEMSTDFPLFMCISIIYICIDICYSWMSCRLHLYFSYFVSLPHCSSVCLIFVGCLCPLVVFLRLPYTVTQCFTHGCMYLYRKYIHYIQVHIFNCKKVRVGSA